MRTLRITRTMAFALLILLVSLLTLIVTVVFQPGARVTAERDIQTLQLVATAAPTPTPQPGVDPAFSEYYYQHGAERIFGFPLGPMTELGDRKVQWFERGRLELYQGGVIQRGRVGAELAEVKQLVFAPHMTAGLFGADDWVRFDETGFGVKGAFRVYWEQNGGVGAFGYPISEEFEEDINGKTLLVQYFERARFELHPDMPPPYTIQLGLLGRELQEAQQDQQVQPTPTPALTPTPFF